MADETYTSRAPMKLAIIGLSQAPALLEEIKDISMEIVGVADFDIQDPVMQEAKRLGIYVTQDYTELLERPDLDLILNLIPDRTVEAIVQQLKPDRAQVIHASTTSFLLTLARETIVRRALVQALSDLSGYFSGLQDQRTILERMFRRILEITEAHGVGLWTAKEGRFELLEGLRLPPSLKAYTFPRGEGCPYREAFAENVPLWVRDIHVETQLQSQGALLDSPFEALLMIPITRGTDAQDALFIFYRDPTLYRKDVLHLLHVLSELLVLILERDGKALGKKDLLIRDELTGLYIDVYFLDRLKIEMKRANRNEMPLSLLYLTLTTEQAGEPAGADMMRLRPYLRALAAAIVETIRNADVPSRYRQVDFAIILPETSSDDAFCLAERLLEKLSSVQMEGIDTEMVRLSIGVASYPQHALKLQELLDNAELAAFLASRAEQNQIRVFPTGHMELNGLTPERIVRRYPKLKELFEVLSAHGARDQTTFRHAQEVAYYSSLIAREVFVHSRTILEVGLAGWLHDIGKMTITGLSVDVQQRLTELPELNQRLHPIIGAYILKNMIQSPVILRGIRYHHTHFDGTGEPPRLKGDKIPLEARIIAVADTYQHLHGLQDDLVFQSRKKIFRKLREKSGMELDPELVEALIRALTVG